MKTEKKRNRWKNVDSYTNRIRDFFKEKNTISLDELYKKFVSKSQSQTNIFHEQHKVRSILYSMLLRGEIIRIEEGHYKKTSTIF